MTEEEFVTTMTLRQRIAWLRSEDGPKGKLSHDRFAAIVGTSRQMVINWENGTEPKKYAKELAAFSGFRPEVFSRREAEELAQASFGRRLAELEVARDRQEATIERILRGLKRAAIAVPGPGAAPRSAATVAPVRRRRKPA